VPARIVLERHAKAFDGGLGSCCFLEKKLISGLFAHLGFSSLASNRADSMS
jgi:hypothetical protein